jgi:hypothetical protein
MKKTRFSEEQMVKLRARLRCERCRSRAVVITFLTPNQRTGNLIQLFDRKSGE